MNTNLLFQGIGVKATRQAVHEHAMSSAACRRQVLRVINQAVRKLYLPHQLCHKTARPGVDLSCNTVQSTIEAPTCRHHRRLLKPGYIAWRDRLLTLPTYGFVRSVTKLWSVELGNIHTCSELL